MNPSFKDACSFGSLLKAYARARRAGRYRQKTLAFGYALESNVLALERELMTGTYRHGAYRQFTVVDAKKRHIKAAGFRDRVVHQAVHKALEPVFERCFIGDSYACRIGKGAHAALRRLESWLRRTPHMRYALACDISRYFASIRHETLLALIERRISDPQLRALCRQIVESSEEAPGCGIPIGNLTSQLFANIYLHKLDEYVKRTLNRTHYVRYMDDFLILGESAAELNDIKGRIAAFLEKELGLTLHPNKANVFPVSGGVPFLGYRLHRFHRKLRKSTVLRFAHRARRQKAQVVAGTLEPEAFAEALRSWLSYAADARTRGLRRSLAGRIGVSLSVPTLGAITTA